MTSDPLSRTKGAGARALALALALAFTSSTAIADDAGALAAPATSDAGSRASTVSGAPADAGTSAAAGGESPHAADGDAADPHGHGGSAGHGNDGFFQPPEDGAVEDPTIPPGQIDIHIADPNGKPLPNTPVTLGILYNSVAKGESRKRVVATTDDKGVARFEHLESGSTVAYRPMVITEGATFSMMPFRLPDKGGMRAVLHVYPVVEAIEDAVVVMQSILYAEVKDDRIQVQELFKIYNLGQTAWVPNNLVISLPEEFTAFTSQQGMTDVSVEAVPKQGVRLRGTFGPGQHMVEFRWQLPYSGESKVSFDVGMPPHTAAARIITPASRDMTLDVPGFPRPQSTSDGQGQRALITEKQLRRDEDALRSVTLNIGGLPTEGPGKVVATLLSAGGILAGLVLATKRPARKSRGRERARLLESLEELERAVAAGDVGPKTYERARREILDAIARTFADDAELTPKPRARTK